MLRRLFEVPVSPSVVLTKSRRQTLLSAVFTTSFTVPVHQYARFFSSAVQPLDQRKPYSDLKDIPRSLVPMKDRSVSNSSKYTGEEPSRIFKPIYSPPPRQIVAEYASDSDIPCATSAALHSLSDARCQPVGQDSIATSNGYTNPNFSTNVESSFG